MRDVVIAGYLRTAQSRSRPRDPERDVFHKLRADDLLARLMPALMERLKLDPKELELVYKLRRVLSDMNPIESVELLRARLIKTKTNAEFLMTMNLS